MTPNLVKIALALQFCLEEIQTGRETIDSVLAQCPRMADELRPELHAANWFWQQSRAFDPRPGFISASRGRILAQIRQENQQVALEGKKGSWFSRILEHEFSIFRFATSLILALFILMGSGGINLISRSSLPGDRLYPVKVGMEKVALVASITPSSDASLHIQYAKRRLLEMQELTIEGRFDDIAPAVNSFEHHVNLALELMSDLPGKDRDGLKTLVHSLETTLNNQAALMSTLSLVVPPDTKLEYQRINLISEKSLFDAQNLLTLISGLPFAL